MNNESQINDDVWNGFPAGTLKIVGTEPDRKDVPPDYRGPVTILLEYADGGHVPPEASHATVSQSLADAAFIRQQLESQAPDPESEQP